MKRRSRGTGLDISIHGDEQEQFRIQLEHNLQKTGLDLELSATEDEREPEDHESSGSVEYGRHTSEPHVFPDLPSFMHRSRDGEEPGHGWSYRMGERDDDEGIHPFAHTHTHDETLSTAMHHASAVTLRTGMGAGRTGAGGHRRDFSGASGGNGEYDPDRPIDKIVAGVNNKHSMLYADSRYNTHDPLVVDDTAELDKILDSGHAVPPNHAGRSSPRPKPKLADHLNQASFSPKRPRSAQLAPPTSPLATRKPLDLSFDMPTPRPVRSTKTAPAAVPLKAQTKAEVKAKVQLATPRIARSKERDHNPFAEVVKTPGRVAYSARPGNANASIGKVHVELPDVTGLTQAVESPVKPLMGYVRYRGDNEREGEARLLKTLNAVQSQLRELETENGISRRRVRELEMELDEAKREVVRERSRMIEREEVATKPRPTTRKGKDRAFGADDLDDERIRERYKEAVEEKKALEALVTSLRAHLTRLTDELAGHKDLLDELRALRDADARTLREKSADVEKLKNEVERLRGEVEVLRGVVEEGLKERRASRVSHGDVSGVEVSVADTAMSADLDNSSEEEEDDDEAGQDEDESRTEGEESEELLTPPAGYRRTSDRDRDRTGFATLGSSAAPGPRFLDDDEMSRIVQEVDERRANLSLVEPPQQQQWRSRAPSPDSVVENQTFMYSPEREKAPTRPAAPTPGLGTRRRPFGGATAGRQAPATAEQDEEELAFPRIRGEKLEKMFFAAPEHNARTCTVCFRRRQRSASGSGGAPSFEVHANEIANERGADEDEGFDEGVKERVDKKDKEYVEFSTEPDYWRRVGAQKGLPPQAVLARVIRELEDDFTHYKSIYVELADQYKVMDAVSDVPRRNLLARHLRDVVDVLETKGDRIAALYDLLKFKEPLGTGAAGGVEDESMWGQPRMASP